MLQAWSVVQWYLTMLFWFGFKQKLANVFAST